MKRHHVIRSFVRGQLPVWGALLALTLLLAPSAARAEPFAFDDVFLGRYVKQTRETRLIEGGIRFEIAPVTAAAKGSISKIRADYPEVNPIFDLLGDVDASSLANADAADIRAELLSLRGLSPQERAAIDTLFPVSGGGSDTQRAVEAVNKLAPFLSDGEQAIAFSLSPFLLANFDPIQLTLEFPLSGFSMAEGTDFTTGNLNLDLLFGHHFGDTVSFGLSYGITMYAPTAGERSDALALGNLLGAPRFDHHYLTLAPYIVLGVDFGIVKLQTHLDVVDMLAVRGTTDDAVTVLLRYGFSAMLTVGEIFGFNVELEGAADIKAGGAFESLFLAGGPRLNLWGFKLAAGVQIPLLTPAGGSIFTAGSSDTDAYAKVNVIVTGGFSF